MRRRRPTRVLVPVAALAAVLTAAAPAAASSGPAPGSPAYLARDAQNIADAYGRQTAPDGQLNPAYGLANAQVIGPEYEAQLLAQAATPTRPALDPGMLVPGWNAGNPYRASWDGTRGHITPVAFTDRYGALLRGDVFTPKAHARDPYTGRALHGPYPGVVIPTGSVQGSEHMYWWLAEDLAERGYVVLTYDVQGQGTSETLPHQGPVADLPYCDLAAPPAPGEESPCPEVPFQQTSNFVYGTEDAIDFFLSNPSHPYEPVPSCASGTSHAAKQKRRAKAGLDAAYNPFWKLLDPQRLGIAGHSYGAAGVSYIGQWDPRVKAIVAWDNLAKPDPGASTGASGGGPEEQGCVDASQRTVPPITKPALGMSADYFIPPLPNTSEPDPLAKSTESLAYSKAGVDSGEIIIRGGTHYDFSFIPNPGFTASLRGADEIAWYTTAWFDRYVKGDRGALRRLLTDRWRHDAQEGAVDPNHDPNMFSFYYRSRLDIAGFHCEDLRTGCAGMVSNDGQPADYSYLKVDTTPDR
jgi:dienelactone hydrolase